MPAGIDLINFEFPEDWELVANVSRTATIINENSHTPIQGFDLGVSLKEDYVAVIAGTNSGRPTWFFAGDIAQVYSFARGAGNPILGKIEPQRTRLAINRLQLVETNRVSTDPFRLKYSPPAWFKDCTIRVYKYVGVKDNFVEDALFDIGNALGIDPNNPNGLISLAFGVIRDLINQRFDELNRRFDELEGGNGGGSFGFDFGTSGGGDFEPRDSQDNSGLGFFQGLL